VMRKRTDDVPAERWRFYGYKSKAEYEAVLARRAARRVRLLARIEAEERDR
jgi:hypothetical protein